MQIIVDINDDYVPEEGDSLDAVTAALEFAEIPASLVTAKVDAHKAIALVKDIAKLNVVDRAVPIGAQISLDKIYRKASRLL